MEQGNIDFWALATSKIHNELSEEEKEQLELLKESSEFEKVLTDSNKLNQQLTYLSQQPTFKATRSWRLIQKHFQSARISVVLQFSKYAAIIIVALALGVLFYPLLHTNVSNNQFTEISVPAAQMSEVKLPDGTRVQLNSNASFKYSSQFGITNRDVELHGEAFFDVSHNKQLPFHIKLKNSQIEVLGTSFNVASFDEEPTSEITLVDGSLQVSSLSGKKLALLRPGQQLIVNNNSQKNTISEVNTDFYINWRDGKIMFDNETLENIAQKMERWYHIDIEFASEDIKQLRVSATILKNKPLTLTYSVFERLLPVIKIDYVYNTDEKDKLLIQKRLPMKH